MDLSKMTTAEARAIVMHAQNIFDASIADQQRTSPKEIQSLPLDLSVGLSRSQAKKVSFPFKAVLVEQATDLDTYVNIIPISNDDGNDPIRLGLKDIYKSEFGFRDCYIYWDAQPNKNIILKFFTRSNIENGRFVLDSVSSNNSIEIGGVQSDENGTYIHKSSVPSGSSNEIRNFTQVFPNNSLLYQDPYSLKIGIKVPVGYKAKILAMKTSNLTAVTTPTSVPPSFNVLVSKTTKASDANFLASFRSNGLAQGVVAQGVLVIDSFSLTPVNNEVDEGSVIFISRGVQMTAGQVDVELMIRLERKVGY